MPHGSIVSHLLKPAATLGLFVMPVFLQTLEMFVTIISILFLTEQRKMCFGKGKVLNASNGEFKPCKQLNNHVKTG